MSEAAEDVRALVSDLVARAKTASKVLAIAPSAQKNAALLAAARALRADEGILAANAKDLAAASGLSAALRDRLKLDPARIDAMARGLEQVAALPDPVGSVAETKRLPNGLSVGRMRVPLGVIAIVYESRPNVTADAAALCLKSGNAVVLRGGKEAFESNHAIAQVMQRAIAEAGLPSDAMAFVPVTSRDAIIEIVQKTGQVDLAIPRGGEALIHFVNEHARVPVIQHYKGVCHVYVDGESDLAMAEAIALNAKIHRPGVCNAMETLLVDQACAATFVPRIVKVMSEGGVEVRGDAKVVGYAPGTKPATAEDWDTEYLDLVVSIAVVDGLDGALAHIAKHGTNHTEAIVTRRYDRAQRFVREVDASLVLVNASTRFNDGGELGLGAEIGISTTKLHAYGAMGLAELCTTKWVAYGDGQVRG